MGGRLANMTNETYAALSERCLQVSENDFDYNKQINKTIIFINT